MEADSRKSVLLKLCGIFKFSKVFADKNYSQKDEEKLTFEKK